MAKEYIERGAALSALLYARGRNPIEDIKSVPAADVVPVRHGRWKPHSKVEYPVYHCSVCGGQALFAWGKQCKSDYCPNCGARMDGDGDV